MSAEPGETETKPESPETTSKPASAKSARSTKSGKGKGNKAPKLTKAQILANKQAQRAAIEETKQKLAAATKEATRLEQEKVELEKGDETAKLDIAHNTLLQGELIHQYRILQQEVNDLETVLANTERDIEETKEYCAAELRVYQRKVKHLMAANQNEFSTSYFTGEEQLYQERQEQLMALQDPERTVDLLRSDENDLLLKNETLITALRTEQDRNFTALREEFERKVEATRATHEQRVRSMRAQLEEQRIRETEELERHKNEQIKALQEKHQRAFEQIKHFFNGVTHNNLEVIKGSKNKISEKKSEINAIRKDVDERFAQRRKLEEPLKALKEDNEKLLKDIEVYKQDKRDLANNKAKIKELEEKKRNLQLEMEVLEQRFEQLESERDALYDQFETSIHDVRQKTEFRAFILEQKVRKMHEGLEQKEMQLQQVMQRKGLDATAISAKIDDVMAAKNSKINKLEVELIKVQRAYNDIYRAYEAKMLKYGIPKEELGFTVMPDGVEFCPNDDDEME